MAATSRSKASPNALRRLVELRFRGSRGAQSWSSSDSGDLAEPNRANQAAAAADCTRERPHYPSKRTGWPMASAAGLCHIADLRPSPTTLQGEQAHRSRFTKAWSPFKMGGCRRNCATVTSQLRTKKEGEARTGSCVVPPLSVGIHRARHSGGGVFMKWSYIPRWKFTDSCGRPGVPGALHLGCAHDAHAACHHATRREFLRAGVAIAGAAGSELTARFSPRYVTY